MKSATERGSYHHGDLANALSAAALELARRGGPEAIVLREAARQVGVSATAAYRHFAGHDDLLETVKQFCQAELVGRMESELASGQPAPDPGREALRRMRALGRGYVRFAQEEPGLFRTAFGRHEMPGIPTDEQWAGLLTAPAFQELTSTLDDLVRHGVLDAAHRVHAEIVAWSSVHGLAMLLLDGPLRLLPDAARQEVITRVLDGTIAGVLGHDPG